MITRLSIVHNAWTAKHGASTRGRINALRGFRYQTLLAIETAVGMFRDGMPAVRGGVFQERLSDILAVARTPRIAQVKRTLDASSLKEALRELWSIHGIVAQAAPDLLALERGLSYGDRRALQQGGGRRGDDCRVASPVPTPPVGIGRDAQHPSLAGPAMPRRRCLICGRGGADRRVRRPAPAPHDMSDPPALTQTGLAVSAVTAAPAVIMASIWAGA